MTKPLHRHNLLRPSYAAMAVIYVAMCMAAAGAQLVINNPPPAVTGFSPTSAIAGSPGFTLTVFGNNFVDGAFVTFGGQPLMPRMLGGSSITVDVPSSALVQAGSRLVSVTNPPPGGGTASALTPFQVTVPPQSPQN